ncbi:MAG: hypothetical protein ACOH5I_10195 [Oligoflexus sp.]
MTSPVLKALPAFITKEPMNLSPDFMRDSISIRDQGIWLTVGRAAQILSPENSRAYGGNFKQPNYRRLVKAAIANTLGAGHHRISLALSASQNAFPHFVDRHSQMLEEQKRILEELVRDIEFKEHPLGEVLHCKVELETVQILFETQAVLQAIPSDLKSFVLWQLGHGDLQQVTLYDGRPIPTTHRRVEGLSSAIRDFAVYTNLALADAVNAWQSGQRIRSDQMNGDMVDVFAEKQRAIREYFATVTQDLLNLNEPYKQRSVAIVLSGGGAKDSMVVDCLRDEIESGGHYRLFVVDELPTRSKECQDPLFTCVQGLLRVADLALDVGNSSLKTGWSAHKNHSFQASYSQAPAVQHSTMK